MKRSVGVTVIAVLSLIGSILTFLIGVLVLVVMAFAPPPQANTFPASPMVFKVMLVLAALVYILPAIWGVVTSVGLFRLSNWARISTIVFSCLLILMGGFSGLATFLMPIHPPNSAASGNTLHAVQIAMGFFWMTLLAIGVWWLVFFMRTPVKRQFAREGSLVSPVTPEVSAGQVQQPSLVPVTQRAPERPLSLTIIAWLVLIGCAFAPLCLILHIPAVFLTKVVTAWMARLYYGVMAAIGLYVGVGLLRFKLPARSVGVLYYFFLLINAAIFYLAPGGQSRMKALIEAQQTIFPWMQMWQRRPELQVDITPAIWLGSVTGLLFIAIPLYFLITRKQAFEAAAGAR